MKKKKLLIGLMIIISSIIIGCTSKISNEDKVIDSVVIDEESKETANSNKKINITRIATTEDMKENETTLILRANEKLLEVEYSKEWEKDELSGLELENKYINSLSMGSITDEIKNNKNIVSREKIEIGGQLLSDYMLIGENFSVLKNNKVYMLDNNYELMEITAYKKLMEETNIDITKFIKSYDENLNVYNISNNRIGIVDTLNDKYYEINRLSIDGGENKQINILTVHDDKVYVLLEEGTSTTIGYIEDNKFNTILDKKSGIDIWVQGGIIFSNNKILISGFLDENYGVWRYDVDKKEITKAMEVKYLYSLFKINKGKNMIIIENLGIGNEKNISIARINDDLEISDIQDITKEILSDENYNDGKSIKGWSNNGNKFYVKTKKVDNGEKLDDVYYEVYEAK